jgi:hypothetical protein
MEGMEDVDFFQGSNHNNVGVAVEEKGKYELARDMHVASIAYMRKPLEDALQSLYVHSISNATSCLIFVTSSS